MLKIGRKTKISPEFARSLQAVCILSLSGCIFHAFLKKSTEIAESPKIRKNSEFRKTFHDAGTLINSLVNSGKGKKVESDTTILLQRFRYDVWLLAVLCHCHRGDDAKAKVLTARKLPKKNPPKDKNPGKSSTKSSKAKAPISAGPSPSHDFSGLRKEFDALEQKFKVSNFGGFFSSLFVATVS